MKIAPIWALALAIPVAGCQSAALAPAPQNKHASDSAPTPQNNTAIPGEYLLKLFPNQPENADTLAQLTKIFQIQPVKVIKPIGNAWYLIILDKNLGRDPGLAAMQATANHSGLIETLQPNFPYGINPPKQPILKWDNPQ
ncbi:MAG: hypothetical protein ACYCY3_06400 [Halothiobacillus sp.]